MRNSQKFIWVIKNFSSLGSDLVDSDEFVFGGCKWFLGVSPTGYAKAGYLSLYLVVADFETLPCGWRRHSRFRLTVVNQISDTLSQREETQRWFDQKMPVHGYKEMLLLSKLNTKEGGFVVNDEVKIVVEVESVKRIFERHPEMALEFRAKNQHLKTSCINALLSLIKTLCQSLQDLSIVDLGQAEQALTYLKYSGFKVDWLERKLEEIKEKKMEEQIGKSRMQELEEELKVLKKKCSDTEAILEKEKEELKDLKKKCSDTDALLEEENKKVLAAARALPLTLDDVV